MYLDGVVPDCNMCHIDDAALVADSLRRLGNGAHLFISPGPTSGPGSNPPPSNGKQMNCSFDTLSAIAPYVRVGADTIDSWDGGDGGEGVSGGFSRYTRFSAPFIAPHHFGDLASLPVGKVHCHGAPPQPKCPNAPLGKCFHARVLQLPTVARRRRAHPRPAGQLNHRRHPHLHSTPAAPALPLRPCPRAAPPPGPDYYVPGNHSAMTADEVYSYASMVAMFRSTWWPSGALSEMNAFAVNLLTNDDVIRITMASTRNRQVIDAASHAFDGPAIVWTVGWAGAVMMSTAGGVTPRCSGRGAARAPLRAP